MVLPRASPAPISAQITISHHFFRRHEITHLNQSRFRHRILYSFRTSFPFLLCWHNVFIICNIFHSSFHIFYHNSCLYGYLLYSIPHLRYSDLPPEAVLLHFLPLILVCGLLLTPIQNRHNVLQQLLRQ